MFVFIWFASTALLYLIGVPIEGAVLMGFIIAVIDNVTSTKEVMVVKE